MDRPAVDYAVTHDGVHIAYQVFGQGPFDILFVGSWFGHIDVRWEWPGYARWFERLSQFARVIVFDKRGVGASDPAPPHSVTLEDWVADARAVMDAAGSERCAVIAFTDATAVAVSLATTFPARVNAIALVNWSYDLFQRREWATEVRVTWGTEATLDSLPVIAPSHAADPRYRDWVMRMQRASGGPGAIASMYTMLGQLDIGPLLHAVRVPTVIVRRTALPTSGRVARQIAAAIDGALYIEVPGEDIHAWAGDVDPLVDEVEAFLTGVRPAPKIDRALLTIVFSDIVGSTSRAAELGDAKWRALLDAHNRSVRRAIAAHHGREILTKGDEFLVTFDGPARAVRCAQAIHAAARQLDLEMRTGIHVGEVELHGDDIAGIAVHIGARVRELASPGEVLVSRTVKDLVAGSGLEFEDRGSHALKGVPEEWQLFSVLD